ncbi:hypothetical protein QJS10_CPA05g00567 [Acorus calamus]|uniref:Uncharacterized protein n=1 Tax=Acorus calamus TaxID=4465 RepID=A0AAV9ETF9_ACOCL|nr:hypothetical protein QJS10_CPA05g00567 [Acorus calamus]
MEAINPDLEDQSSPEKANNQASSSVRTVPFTDRTLSSAANLVQLLPSGTVLAFQALSPSFSNHGTCYTSNKYLSLSLLIVCSLSCIFFSFTDSFLGGDGKHYYGVSTVRGLYVFNDDCVTGEERRRRFGDLRKYKIRLLDFVHAFLSVVLFWTVSWGDADIQTCFFPDGGHNEMEVLVNLPLGVGVLSSLVFMVFPTSRKGMGYSDASPR